MHTVWNSQCPEGKADCGGELVIVYTINQIHNLSCTLTSETRPNINYCSTLASPPILHRFQSQVSHLQVKPLQIANQMIRMIAMMMPATISFIFMFCIHIFLLKERPCFWK